MVKEWQRQLGCKYVDGIISGQRSYNCKTILWAITVTARDSGGSPMDDPYTVAISHGEGRFVANDEVLRTLVANGQVATQYVDEAGMPSMNLNVNPNGSVAAIEGITSPDGRVFGKMGHVERRGDNLYANVPGNAWMPVFEGGVAYFA